MTIILNDTFAFSSAHFTCSPNDDGTVVLVAEASTLGYHGPRRIYDDACDAGIAVRSERTGALVRYYLKEEEMDRSGEDVAGWRFLPISEDVRRTPSAGHTSVLIIND